MIAFLMINIMAKVIFNYKNLNTPLFLRRKIVPTFCGKSPTVLWTEATDEASSKVAEHFHPFCEMSFLTFQLSLKLY